MTVASPARPERRAAGAHRLVCRSCGAAEDVDRAAEHDPCLKPATGTGFRIEAAEVTFRGLCPACRARADGD
ncbi:hypothetical protein GCM10010402_11160 [Actinomadura luteofluorescens]|uniref:hypothetical protein n=1 Tax=Actinomadura luteofluorescens TaxID=46163 RepID=UPI002164C352|nr:hypothetical protein [Actinomadura glauciflava]MCR3741567.1 hypothetical protein [Actinomadura glauciflava]